MFVRDEKMQWKSVNGKKRRIVKVVKTRAQKYRGKYKTKKTGYCNFLSKRNEEEEFNKLRPPKKGR